MTRRITDADGICDGVCDERDQRDKGDGKDKFKEYHLHGGGGWWEKLKRPGQTDERIQRSEEGI